MTTSVTRLQAALPVFGPLNLLAVLSGQFLAVVDYFVVNVALPDIATELHTGQATLEMIVAGYGLSYALLLVLGGRLGDMFGRKRLFLTGLALFTMTSLLCGLAPTAATLVIARIAQGASAAMMVPQVLATIQSSTTGHARARALGVFGAGTGIASVLGQLAGGLLVAADIGGLGWRPIFLVNVPIGILAFFFATRWMPDTRASARAGIDLAGTGIFAVAMALLLGGLFAGQEFGWTWWSLTPLLLATVVAWWFVRVEKGVERRGGHALLPPSMLRLPSMRNGLTAAIPFFIGFGGFSFGYVIALQKGLGFSPLACGVALTPLGIAFLISSLNSARLVQRFGNRGVHVGIALQILGMAGIALTIAWWWPHVVILDLVPWAALVGAGNGLVMGPLFRIVLLHVPTEHAGTGGGLLSTTQQTALAVGVSVLGAVLGSFAQVRDGTLALLALAVLASMAFAVRARRLPDPRLA